MNLFYSFFLQARSCASTLVATVISLALTDDHNGKNITNFDASSPPDTRRLGSRLRRQLTKTDSDCDLLMGLGTSP
jgi:hypothetical protein